MLSNASKLLPAIASVFFLILTLPPIGLSFFAYIAFIPLGAVILKSEGRAVVASNGVVFGFLLTLGIYAGAGWLAFPLGIVLGAISGVTLISGSLLYRRFKHPLALFLLPVVTFGIEFGCDYANMSGLTASFTVTSTPILAQTAALGGAYLVSFTIYTINIAILLALSTQLHAAARRACGGVALGVFGLVLAYGGYRLNLPLGPGEELSVMVVQSWIDYEYIDETGQLQRTSLGIDPMAQWQLIIDRVAAVEPDIVVMPETEFGHPVGIPNEVYIPNPPVIPANIKDTTWLMYKKALDENDKKMFRKYVTTYTAADGLLHVRPKVRALPVAESDVITAPLSEAKTHPRAPGNPATMICYESILGGINRHYAPQMPGFIAVSSGAINTLSASRAVTRVIEIVQLEISRIRAIESGKYVLRAANAVGSAVIDPRGRLIAVAPNNEFATLTATIRTQQELTPYMRMAVWLND
jgi:apolipoprotein N-acyltransferase